MLVITVIDPNFIKTHNYSIYSMSTLFTDNDKLNVQPYTNFCRPNDKYGLRKFLLNVINRKDKNNNFILYHFMEYKRDIINKEILLGLRKLNIRTIWYFNDMHDESKTPFIEYYSNILTPDLIFCKLFYTNIINRIIGTGWSLPDKLINEFPEKEFNKVLFYGYCKKEIYPTRNWIYENKDKIINLEVLEHCGYGKESTFKKKHKLHGLNFIKHLKKYKAAIITSAKYPLWYFVSKYVESFCCGCLTFCEYHPLLDKYGMKPYYHYIPINSLNYNYDQNINPFLLKKDISVDELNFKIKKYLNTNEGNEIANNGYLFAKKYFGNSYNFNKIYKELNLNH